MDPLKGMSKKEREDFYRRKIQSRKSDRIDLMKDKPITKWQRKTLLRLGIDIVGISNKYEAKIAIESHKE